MSEKISGCLSFFKIEIAEKAMGGCIAKFACSQVEKIGGCLAVFSTKQDAKIGGCLAYFKVNIKENTRAFQFSGTAKNPFDLAVFIDGVEFDICKLVDNIKITRTVNCASIAELTLRLDCGEIEFYQYAGKKIEMFALTADKSYKIYQGIINTPKYNVFTKRILLNCTDEKINKINNLPQYIIDSIGCYCDKMWGNKKDKDFIFSKRINTISSDYYFDTNGYFYLTAWQPKNYPDFNIKCTDIKYSNFDFSGLQVGNVVNKVNLLFQFNYYRKMQRDLKQRYFWRIWGNMAATDADFIKAVNSEYGGFIPAPPVNGVLQAAAGAGWTLGDFSYNGLPPAGIYGGLYWNPNTTNCTKKIQVTDNKGRPVYKDGQPVMQCGEYQYNNGENYFATNAEWTISKRWIQNIQENFNIELSNLGSIDLFGEKSENINFNLKLELAENESEDWNNYPCFFRPQGVRLENGDYAIDLSQNGYQDYLAALNYSLNVAKTKILRSHCDNNVKAELKFSPDFDLKHTVHFDTEFFNGNVKIYEIVHNIDLSKKTAFTTIQCKWFKGFNGDDLTLPSRPVLPSIQRVKSQMTFTNHNIYKYSRPSIANTVIIGGNQDINKDYCIAKNGEDNLYGYVIQIYIANSIPNPQNNYNRKASAIKFAVKTPDIEKESTDSLSVELNNYQNLEIPDNNIYMAMYCGE